MPITRTAAGTGFFASRFWHVFCVLAAGGIFWSDSWTPLGFDHGSLYVLLLIVIATTSSERLLVGIAGLAVVLTIAGAFISPPGIDTTFAAINRLTSVLEIVGFTWASTLIRRQLLAQNTLNKELTHSRRLISEQRELLEIAAATSRIGGWTLRLDDQHISWSDQVCRLHGVPTGHSPSLEAALSFYTPRWQSAIKEALQRCITDGTPFDEEAEITTANGRHVWVRVSGQRVHDTADDAGQVQGFVQDITQDKESQFILDQQRTRFHQLADSVPQIIWTADPDGTLDYANRAYFDYSGVEDPAAVMGLDWIKQLHPDDVRDCLKAWRCCLAEKSSYSQAFRIRSRSGDYRWHLVQAHPTKDDHGILRKWCGSAVDIHESRQLAESRIRVLESITDAFMTMDAQWRITYANREAEQLLQANREHLLGRVVWEAFPGAENFRARYEQVVANQASAAFEEYYTEMRRWFEVRAFPAELGGLIVYFRDVTDAHRQADEMRLARERFELVTRVTTDTVWDWDLTTDRLWWSDRIFTLFGYTQAELTPDSTSWTSRIHPEDKERVMTGILAAIDGNVTDWEDEYRFQRKGGDYAFVLDKGYILRDTEGKATRMIGGMVDTTEQRLLQERLTQTERLEALGQLTGGVAHDFNNLLTVILGNGGLLAEELRDNPRHHALVDLINRAASRAADLTRHLLAFARKQALEPRSTDVTSLINGMENLLHRTLMDNIEIEFVHSSGLHHALIDGSQLENALLNLCLNARDAMPEGGKLTIETKNVTLDESYADQYGEVLPGEYVMISVSDTGVGMAPEILKQVFNPFFTTKEPGKGTGLGLSMVYGFAKQSRGHIKIYSELGHGTTVKLYVPRADGQLAEASSDCMTPVSGGDETILLVEDDMMVSSYACELLLGKGYRVLLANNGPEALQILNSSHHIDLLFTDVIMPGGLNGRQLADSAMRLRPALKVLFTSGYSENAIMHHGRLDPGVNLLSKPYQSKELLRKVRQLLGPPPASH